MTTNLTKAELKKIATARATLEKREKEKRAQAVKRGDAVAREAALGARLATAAGNARDGRRARLDKAGLDRAKREKSQATASLAKLDMEIDGLREAIDDLVLRDRGDPLAALDGGHPIALLPVRIETRFVGAALKVRIFPDVAHVDQLEERLTREERSYGRGFWRSLWRGEDADELWDALVAEAPPNRASWIVEATRPTNYQNIGVGRPRFSAEGTRLKGLRQAPIAALMPNRWIVVGYRDGKEVLRKRGGVVRDPLRVGVAPDDPEDEATAPSEPKSAEGRLENPAHDQQDALPIDEGARWLVDFDEAVSAGMALTIDAQDDARFARGYDRLIIAGVDHRASPATAAAALEGVFRAQYHTEGLGFLARGAPTNASEEDEVPPAPEPTNPALPVDPARGNSSRVANALGLLESSVLHRLRGADEEHGAGAADMVTALWEPTAGYFLNQILEPLADKDEIGNLRGHAIDFLRFGGPFPALRVGAQPLGLLPVTSIASHEPLNGEREVAAAVKAAWPFWALSTSKAARLGDGDDPATDLIALLQRTPNSESFRFREVFGPVAIANSEGAMELAAAQDFMARLTIAMMGVTGTRPAIVDMTVSDQQRELRIPLVTGDPLGAARLAKNYIATIHKQLGRIGGYRDLEKRAEEAATLLEALLIHAAEMEMNRVVANVVAVQLDLEIDPSRLALAPEFSDRTGPDPAGAPRSATSVRAAGGAAGARVEGGPPGRQTYKSPRALALGRLPGVSGNRSIADRVATWSRDRLGRAPGGRTFSEFRGALGRLGDRSSQELHDLASGTLDLFSHRYDAWATSLATRRLAERRKSRPTGIHVGAYGWVEDLRRRSTPVSEGFIHGPSIAHASTGAILRGGHLARNDATAAPFAVGLDSRRVRDAKTLIEGMRTGQSLSALLGYRWERRLRDLGPEFAAYILPARRAYPLPEALDRDATPPVESIAARNVADGIALAELDAAGRGQFLAAAQVAPSHVQPVRTALDELAAALDAVGDLLTAEAVHQTVLGNTERAAAALDALDRQTPPPELGVAKAPGNGQAFGHRVMLVFDDAPPLAGWKDLVDPRAAAAPRINAWVGHILGDPARFRFRATILDADGAKVGVVETTLADLEQSALACVLGTAARQDQASEFERRLESAFRAAAAIPEGGTLAPQLGSWDDSNADAGLEEFVATAEAVLDLLASARPADARDFSHPGAQAMPDPDVAEIAGRAERALDAARSVAGVTPAAISALSDVALRRFLSDAAALGLPEAVQMTDDRTTLEALAERVVERARTRVDAAEALALDPEAGPTELAKRHGDRLKAVFGDAFPAVPFERIPSDAIQAFNESSADPAMLGDEPLAATEWLQKHALVRPGIERLWVVLASAEARELDVGTTSLVVGQFPFQAGSPWIGRAAAFDEGAPRADVSVLIHGTAGTGLEDRVMALAIDQWEETAPSTSRVTGVSFHFDAPGARAPQSVLLAVHPAAKPGAWSEDLLFEIISETAELAKMRALDIDDVAGMGRFLPACHLPFDLERNGPSFMLEKVAFNASRTWSLDWRRR